LGKRPWRFTTCRLLAGATLQLGFLIPAIYLFNGYTSNYGQIVTFETGQWSKGAIIDIMAVLSNQSTQCPSGYELVPVNFPGT
jgi:hypothetical protein